MRKSITWPLFLSLFTIISCSNKEDDYSAVLSDSTYIEDIRRIDHAIYLAEGWNVMVPFESYLFARANRSFFSIKLSPEADYIVISVRRFELTNGDFHPFSEHTFNIPQKNVSIHRSFLIQNGTTTLGELIDVNTILLHRSLEYSWAETDLDQTDANSISWASPGAQAVKRN